MTISHCTSPVGGEWCCNMDAANSASLIVSCLKVASTESMVVDPSDGVLDRSKVIWASVAMMSSMTK